MSTENNLRRSKYFIIPAYPAKGILYITGDNPEFISGHVRLRGKDHGRYPYNYSEMIDNIFGKEENTIEVCSHSVRGRNWSHRTKISSCYTVDINPETRPDLVDDGQELRLVPTISSIDPPYNENTARIMYKNCSPHNKKAT
jgi:hypothetical protein